jgi:hypothetical protein
VHLRAPVRRIIASLSRFPVLSGITPMMRVLPVLLVVAVVGCNRLAPTNPAIAPSNGPVTPAQDGGSEGYPSKAEVLDYLDGKELPLHPKDQPNGKPSETVTLRKDRIEALSVEQSGTSFDNGPWQTRITFIVEAGNAKYGVRATVQHRRVENKRAFFGIEYSEVAKQ